jgi:hypothetical protein
MKFSEAFQGKYLKATDILGKRIPVTISHVEMERVGADKELKPVAYFVGKEKGLVLNKGNCSIIWGCNGSEEMNEWGGTKITLYTAPTTKPDGTPTMGLRVDIPDVPQPTRPPSRAASRPEPVTVEPIPEDDFTDDGSDVPF